LEQNLVVETNNSLRQEMSFTKDLLSIIISFFINVIFIIGGNIFLLDNNIIFTVIGFALMLYGIFSLSQVFSNLGSALNYKKTQSELQGLYLRRSLPVCPYLKSGFSGFKCQLEFSEPFNIQLDLPKCHVEQDFKQHWFDKAPNVLLKAKESTDRNLVTYLAALGRAKYSPAIPFLVEILEYPLLSKKVLFIFESANNADINTLRDQFIENFTSKKAVLTEEDAQFEKTNLINEFNEIVESLTNKNLIVLVNDTLNKSDIQIDDKFLLRWKLYSTPLIKQYTIASLSFLEDPELIPKFFDIFLNSKDSKMVKYAKNGLLKLKGHLERPLIELLENEEISDPKKTALIELAGSIKSDNLFTRIKKFSESDNETLSYFAISALGNYKEQGLSSILELLEQAPTDLKIDSGRATCAKYPVDSFNILVKLLDERSDLPEDFLEIISSIFEELDHVLIKKYFSSLSQEEQDRIDQIFEKNDMLHHLDYFVGK
jgi:hypothetical protein